MSIKYPDIEVALTGTDGNAIALVGTVSRALRSAGVDHSEIDAFRKEALSGNYDNVLATCAAWVNVS